MLKALESLGISGPGILIVLLAIAIGILYQTSPSFLWDMARVIGITAPVWLPIVSLVVFWKLWVVYVRAKFFSSQEYVLLEIRLPREITKSPLAMEAVFSGLHQGSGETTFIDRYWLGKTRTWFSLEIVSIGGDLRFFIWTRAFFKDIVEAQIYAQYPDIEIYEAPDYTQGIFFEPDKMSVWGCDFKLSMPDPYPIKTYVDYGLDKDPKEEQKIDPLSNMLEFMGNLKPGHQMWIQILIRVNKSEKGDWKAEAKAEVEKIRQSATQTNDESGFSMTLLTPGQQDTLKAIERSVSKLAFDTGIRCIYLAEADKFNPTNIVGMLGTIKQFNSNTLNKFVPARWLIDFDFPWQDFREIRQNRARRRLIDAYKRRSWFHPPYRTPHFVLNTEELATIFHFPGGVVQTPTMSRVGSRKAEAPINLPIKDQ